MIQFTAAGHEADRLLLVGKSRTGKTSLARVLLRRAAEMDAPIVYLDPKGLNRTGYDVIDAGAFVGLSTASGAAQLRTLLGGHERRVTVHLSNMPKVKDADQFDAVCGAAFEHGNLLVVYDDAGGIEDGTPSYYVNRIATMGGERGVGFMPMVQRVYNIPRVFLTESSHIICFHFRDEKGRQRLAAEASPELAEACAPLQFQDFRFAWYRAATDEVTVYPPLPRGMVE